MKFLKLNTFMYFSVLFMFNFDANAQSMTIEEVIVSAEKREESLQDISQSVTALTEEELETKNITDFVGLSAIAPGVTVAKNEGYKTIISIRGVGDETNQNAIAAPSVALHMDGIFIASKFSLRTDFIDLERIEVLRGPQGTLFGQNSTGGTINVISQKPSFDAAKGKTDLAMGNYGLIKFRGAFNKPLSDKVATRLSVVSTDRDGFSENILNGQDLDDADHTSLRTDWFFDISDTTSLRVFGQFFEANNNGAAMKGLDDSTPNPRKLAQDSASDYRLSSEVIAAILNVELGFADLKVLTSIQEDDIYVSRDNDRHNFGDVHASGPLQGIPYIAAEYRPETSIVDTKTFEVNLISNEPINDKIDWIVGALYFDHKIANSIYEVKDVNNIKQVDLMDGAFTPYVHDPICATNPFAGVCFAAFNAELGFVSEAYPTRESLSVYGQATYNVQDNMRYIFGMRYTEDSFSSDVTNFFGLQKYLIEDEIDEKTGKAPQLIYPLFKSEIIDAFELGLKTDLMDGRMRANVSAFMYDYENLQFQSTDPDVYRGGVANIPESEMSGVELELIGILSDSLSMDLRISTLDTEITADYEALDNIKSELYFFGEEPQRYALRENIKGNRLAKSPEFTANFGLQYNGELKSGVPLRATAEVIHRGDFQQRVFNSPFVDQVDSYTVVNLTTSIEISDTAGVDFMILNASDKDGVNSAMTDVFGVAGTGIELIPPRQFILRVRKSY
ncbi:MAG: TonB-dependent receptor [Proteobacteria bacterium]|nr:TonB-dependent receptor [Pseudomonadota bacterium]